MAHEEGLQSSPSLSRLPTNSVWSYKQNHAFSVVGSSLWNGLSLALRLFSLTLLCSPTNCPF